MNSPVKLIAGIVALTGFVVAAVAGLGAGNAAETTLIRCIGAMFICYFAGLPLGMICEHVIKEHIKNYVAEHPIPVQPMTVSEATDRISTPSNVDGKKSVV